MNIIKKFLKKDCTWIIDEYKTPKFYIGILFLFVYSIGNILTDNIATKITSYLHPEYTYGSNEFYKFLGTNPWEFTLVIISWLLILFLIMYIVGLRFFGSYKNTDKKKILRWFIIGIITIFLLQGISILLEQINGSTTANQELLNRQLLNMDWIKKIVVFILIPAFSEELIMRGVVQRYIFTKYPYVGIFMSAFLFQGMHYTTRVSDAMLYFTSGLVNAIIFYKTGRLELAMIIHAINNLVALILLSITL